MATVALLLGMGISGYARYTTVIANMTSQDTVILGQPGGHASQADPVASVFVSLGINLIVWLVGLFVSYMAHDQHFDLMSADLERKRLTGAFEKKRRPYEKQIKLVELEKEEKIQGLHNATRAAETATEDQRQKLAGVDQIEDKHYGKLANLLQPLVDNYQTCLCSALIAKRHRILIGANTLSGEEYAQMSLKLNSKILREII
jgi:hypothetical protein